MKGLVPVNATRHKNQTSYADSSLIFNINIFSSSNVKAS